MANKKTKPTKEKKSAKKKAAPIQPGTKFKLGENIWEEKRDKTFTAKSNIYNVVVFKKFGKQTQTTPMVQMREVTDENGNSYLENTKLKFIIPMPETRYTNIINGEPGFYFLKINKQFFVANMDVDEATGEVQLRIYNDTEVDNYLKTRERIAAKYAKEKGWLETNGNTIIMILGIIGFVFIMWYGLNTLSKAVTTFDDNMEQILNSPAVERSDLAKLNKAVDNLEKTVNTQNEIIEEQQAAQAKQEDEIPN